MPKNNNLKPVELPMNIRFGEQPKTNIKVLEEAIRVELIDAPTMEQLKSFIPAFVNATWMEDFDKEMDKTSLQKDESIIKMLTGKTLPGALETFRFTFLIDGITLQEVTHILRHRTATFSAVCTGDRFMHDDDVFIPEAIKNSVHEEEYIELAKRSKQLYADLVNEKEVSLMDARYALPRSTRQTYFMSISYKDLLGFLRQRIDRAIQPKSDNILAYLMWVEMCKRLPILAALDLVDFNMPSWFFIKTTRTGHSTNLYIPEEQNDKFEWNEDDFIYKKTREELNGMPGLITPIDYVSSFEKILIQKTQELEKIKEQFLKDFPETSELIKVLKEQK